VGRDEGGQRTVVEHLARTLARALVIAGGSFWAIAIFAVPYVYGNVSLAESARTGSWPFLAALVIFAVGWRYERLASVLLAGACAAVIVWGVIYGWEAGVWLIMTTVLIAPMAVAALLFVLAARAEEKRSLESSKQAPAE
jgi:hypothetical protein